MELAESGIEISNVAQRITHTQEVKTGVSEGKLLRMPLNQVDFQGAPRLGEHAVTDIQTKDRVFAPCQNDSLAGHQTRTGGHVKYSPTWLESSPLQSMPSIPVTRTPGEEQVNAVVVLGCPVEQPADEGGPPGLVCIVLF